MKERSVQVNGRGIVSVQPDMAHLHLGVKTRDKEVASGQEQNRTVMLKVMERLKEFHIDDADIKTAAYHVGPVYSYRDNQELFEGYEVEHSIRLTLYDMEALPLVLDALFQEGLNLSGGIDFQVRDREKYYRQALTAALVDARETAELICASEGLTLAKPLHIYEGEGAPSFFRESAPAVYAMARDAGFGASPITAGSMDIEASVTVVYGQKE